MPTVYNHFNGTVKIFESNKPDKAILIPSHGSSNIQLSNFRVVIGDRQVYVIKQATPQVHLGLVTSFNSAVDATTNTVTIVPDMIEVRLHNKLNIPLTFTFYSSKNGPYLKVKVPPREMIRVDSGTRRSDMIRNDEGIFSDYNFKDIVTDVFFGYVSPCYVPLHQGQIIPPYCYSL